MNAHDHLISLGWAGPGHSLDSRPGALGTYKQKGHRGLAYDPTKDPLKVGNIGNGLVKPLLVSQRKNRFGLGRKAHEAPAGNEWWLKGFESALGNIGKSESERSSGTNTPVDTTTTGKHGGLYSFFVRGQIMQGTIDQDMMNRSSRKRKSEEFEDDNGLRLNPRPTSPKKPSTAEEFQMVGAFMRERDREAKRRSKLGKASDAEQFAQIGEFFGVVEKQRRKKRKSEAMTSQMDEHEEERPGEGRAETKEERRARRRRDREERAARDDKKSDSEDSAAKAARRAERKRRKAAKAAKKN